MAIEMATTGPGMAIEEEADGRQAANRVTRDSSPQQHL